MMQLSAQTQDDWASKGHERAWLQLEGTEELKMNPSVPQQEEQTDATEGKVIIDYDLDIDYDGSEPKNEPVAQEEKEENSNAEYVNMEMTCGGTFHQRMMPCNVMQRIQWIH